MYLLTYRKAGLETASRIIVFSMSARPNGLNQLINSCSSREGALSARK